MQCFDLVWGYMFKVITSVADVHDRTCYNQLQNGHFQFNMYVCTCLVCAKIGHVDTQLKSHILICKDGLGEKMEMSLFFQTFSDEADHMCLGLV